MAGWINFLKNGISGNSVTTISRRKSVDRRVSFTCPLGRHASRRRGITDARHCHSTAEHYTLHSTLDSHGMQFCTVFAL
ncbi:hypothetical protein J6590_048961 [Homalodisca vitripennis]|nr:hypothetical protein J6590_048961 [Homalodisca vitripennis]